MIVEPYTWCRDVDMPLYSMVAGLHGIRIAWLLRGDTYGALIMYDGEGRVISVVPISASLLRGMDVGPDMIVMIVTNGGSTTIIRRRE